MISGKVYRTVADGSWSVPRRIEAMGAMRVARQALSPMPELLSYWLPPQDAKALIRYLNEQIAEMVVLAPDRFIGLGAVPLQDVDSAIVELNFITDELSFPGVEIASHVNGVSIGDARFEPFFAAAERIGALGVLLPRLVHAWNAIPKAKESLTESPAVTARRFLGL
ncbi:MAG: amidohydrolase family protein [Burkholderiales bacterium]